MRWNLVAHRSGTAAIEFALVFPLFVMIFFGLAAYGVYFGASHSIQQIAADAARTAVAGLDTAERQRLVSDFIERHAAGYLFIDSARMSVETRDAAAGEPRLVVTVRYDARDLPIWGMLGDVPLPSLLIVRSSTVRMGGY
jgi:Flp pilus assembly protein TadG